MDDYLIRINESSIKSHEIKGEDAIEKYQCIKNLMDIIFSRSIDDKQAQIIDYDFFDINGTVLIYGIPGVGKTTIMKKCMLYALKKYCVDCYELDLSFIITSRLGDATKKLGEALDGFMKFEKGILFIDEIDRLCVNRNDEHISELNRMLIEFMQFLDKICFDDKKFVLGCTNVKERLDDALLRRFSICEEMKNPSKTEIITFANECAKKAGIKETIIALTDGSKISTFDSVKSVFRRGILNHSIEELTKYFDMEA